MSTDPIAAYQEALRNFDAATRQIERTVEVIISAASKLRVWKRVSISNIDLGFPVEASAPDYCINGKEWPTARQLGEALVNWHQAHQAVRAKWERIPKDQRTGLVPPS